MARRTSAIVHGAMEFALEDWPVDLTQIGRCGVVFHADNNAVRVEEISDRRAFAQEFRIGSHTKRGFAAAAVGGKRPLQFKTGARGNGALFNH